MTSSIDILVLDDGGADEAVIRSLLGSDAELRLVGYVDGLGHHNVPADIVVVACGQYSEGAAAHIRDARDEKPGRPVVLVTQGAPNGFVDHAFEAGVADLILLPQPCDVEQARAMSPQVRFTLRKALGGRRGGDTPGTGRMVVILGPKGGSGKTLTATNLGAALADRGNRVVVVDVDLQFGDVGLALGLAPTRTLYDLVSSGGSLDAEKLQSFLVRHSSGVDALLAPRRPDEAGLVTVDFLREIYAMLRTTHDVVIVDTPPAFTPEVIAAIDASSDICMVGMLDSLSLKNTRLGFETLELMGYAETDLRFLLNRADSQVGISHDDVRAIVGRTPDVLVPSDRAVTRSVNEGSPIALKTPGSAAGKAFGDLAAMYAGAQPDIPKRRRRRAFARAN